MREKVVIDENGWIQIPSTIRRRVGLLKKTDIMIAPYSDGVIIVHSVPDGKLDNMIEKTQAALSLEESFKTIHAKNLGVSDKDIVKEIKKYRKAKRKSG